MTKKIAIVMAACLALWVWAAPAGAAAKSAAELLQDGNYAEEIEGDLDKAVKIYDQVIAASSSSRSTVAQAMYRKGMCFLKKRDEQAARATLEKLLADFADQTAVIDKARAVLEDLTVVDLASLMPPQTLAYVELGSPGRQIETILSLLKGTPFENPLAAVGGAGQGGGPDFLSSLFNPAMMAEFKKIRGMAVGVTGLSQNNPPFVAVLYPGKSDALRGLLLAALGMAGQRVDPVEGMETYSIHNSAYAAYDENVIIIGHPLEQLQWSVKRHKGAIREPSLATSTGSFSKLGKDTRQANMLTVWVNVDQLYAGARKLFPDGQMPQEVRMADGIADFNGIDDLTVQVAFKEQGISLDTNFQFKDGHHCLAYDFIRTPNLQKAALESVPSEAIGLVSFAMADAQSAQAKAASQRLQHLTGLDIGREIYSNIEQVTLFALPAPEGAQPSEGLPLIAQCAGLTLTSHDPQQTRQVLSTLLSVAQLIAGSQQGQPAESVPGRYQIGLANGKTLYCHMDQAGKSTVLSLNPTVVEASIQAQKSGRSVCRAGVLSKAVNALAPATSKLILLNHGGVIRMVAAHMPLPADPNNVIRQAVSQLAQACDKTLVQVSTVEQLNQFSMRVAVDNLPPLNQVVGPIMQISKAMQSQGGGAWGGGSEGSQPPAQSAVVSQAAVPPVIDGKVDEVWGKAQSYTLGHSYYKPVTGPEDCSASFKALWDKDGLYLLVDVLDDDLRHDSSEYWNDDSIEVFIDADNSKSGSYDSDDYQYHFDWDATSPKMGESQHQKTEGVKYALVKTDKGYRLEVAYPWTTLGVKQPGAGTTIGLDVQVNDDDGGGERDHKIAWNAARDNAYQVPAVFGIASLAGPDN
jgi:hypothetical protein